MNYSIQILRGIAALLVVLYHSFIKYDQYYGGEFSFEMGIVGVDIFFVISGYIMCMIYSKKSLVLTDFLIDRIRRIMPIYLILTSVAYVAYLTLPALVNSSGGHTYILESFILWPVDGKFLIQNGWTLSYEFYFYIIFGIATLLFGHFFYSCVLIILLPIIAGYIGLDWANGFLMDTIVYEFFYGVVGFYICKLSRNNFFFVFLIATFSLFLLWAVDHRAGTYGVAAFVIVTICSRIKLSEEMIDKHRGLLVLERIGVSSYSLYLIHAFTLVFLAKIYESLINIESQYLFITIIGLGSVIVGWYFYLLIEKPLDVFLRKALR
jgi:exopolysaccharide production protein ExoZ